MIKIDKYFYFFIVLICRDLLLRSLLLFLRQFLGQGSSVDMSRSHAAHVGCGRYDMCIIGVMVPYPLPGSPMPCS